MRTPEATSSSSALSLSTSAIHSPKSTTLVIPSSPSKEELRWADYEQGLVQGSPGPPPLFIQSEVTTPSEFILPPLQCERNGSFRKTLVLDLDQTLIDCALVNVIPHSKPADFVYKDVNGGRAQVWCRPGLQEFLSNVSCLFEVVLFTAAGQRHADAVLDFIDPNQSFFHHRLYQQHTTPDDDWPWVKDLRRLGRDISNVLIIDDCQSAANATPANWVGIKPFNQSNAFWTKDTALNDILTFLIEHVLPASDVRRAISIHYNNMLRKPVLCSLSSRANKVDQEEERESMCKQSLMRVSRVVNNVYRHSLPLSSNPSSSLNAQEGETTCSVNVLEC